MIDSKTWRSVSEVVIAEIVASQAAHGRGRGTGAAMTDGGTRNLVLQFSTASSVHRFVPSVSNVLLLPLPGLYHFESSKPF